MNNRRKLKPQVKVALIILGVFFGFIILENLIGGVGHLIKSAKNQIEYNKNEEIYEQTPEYQKGEKISEFVTEILTCITNGNFEEVYRLTDPDYIEALDIDSVDKLKTIVENHFGAIPKNISLMDYYKNNGRYICEVSIEKDDGIENVDVLVTDRGGDNYYIIIDNVKSIEKYDKQFRFNDSEFEFDIKYKVKRPAEEILILEAHNKTSNNLVGSLTSTVLVKSSRAECTLKDSEALEKVEFPAGETVKIMLVFPNGKYEAYPDEALRLKVDFDNSTKIHKTINMVPKDAY